MKRRWKIFWIVCGVMFLAGLICCVVADRVFGVTGNDIFAEFPHGIVIGSDDDTDDDWDDDWDDDDDDDDDDDAKDTSEHADAKEEQSRKEAVMNGKNVIEGNGKAVYQHITNMKSNIYAGTVYLKTADNTGEIMVESVGISEKLGFYAYEQDGTLYLKTNKKIKNTNNIGKGSITITIPANMKFDEIDLTLKAGELKADKLVAGKMEVKNGAGKVYLQDFTADNAEFECGAGSLSGNGDATEKIKVDCGVGEVDLKLKGSKKDYNYDLECGIGEITCGDDRYSGFGKEVHLDNKASKNMEIDCGIGQINIDYVTEL